MRRGESGQLGCQIAGDVPLAIEEPGELRLVGAGGGEAGFEVGGGGIVGLEGGGDGVDDQEGGAGGWEGGGRVVEEREEVRKSAGLDVEEVLGEGLGVRVCVGVEVRGWW